MAIQSKIPRAPRAAAREDHHGRGFPDRTCLACVTLIFLQDMGPHQALSFLAALAAFSPTCFGQAGKAELFGTIQDPQGLAVTKAHVAGEEQATGVRSKVITDDRGDYHLLGLPAGQYVLTVEKPGFRPYRQEGITLRIGDQIRLGVKLELGQSSQSVDVNAQASLLETASGAVGYHVIQPQLETLPLDGRNFIPLPESPCRAAGRCCHGSTGAGRGPTNTSTTESVFYNRSPVRWLFTRSSTPWRNSS
jgi:hypothetical protein